MNLSENRTFPFAPTAFLGDSRQADVGAGLDWLHQGWALFIIHPVAWLLFSLLWLPAALSVVAAPFVVIRMAAICQKLILTTKKISAVDFLPIGGKTVFALWWLGTLWAALFFTLGFLIFLLWQNSFFYGDLRVGSFFLAALKILTIMGLVTLIFPISVLLYFASMLAFFHQMPPQKALAASGIAVIRNFLPLSVLLLFLLPCVFFALLPLGLGLLPFFVVFSGALYAAYRDVFIES